MHENANITCAIAETEMSFSIVLSMQPRTGGGGGASREDLIGGIAKDMEDRYARKSTKTNTLLFFQGHALNPVIVRRVSIHEEHSTRGFEPDPS